MPIIQHLGTAASFGDGRPPTNQSTFGSGGNKTTETINGISYQVHKFYYKDGVNQSFTVSSETIQTADIFVIGGGGGGATGNDISNSNGGGGGGGGLSYKTDVIIEAGTHAITIGNGGAGRKNWNTAGSGGGQSRFNGGGHDMI